MPTQTDRARVLFHGHVQGVGFRWTTRRLAGGHPGVTGRVRNLPDGSVELVAEGERADVEAFIADINERMAGYIVRANIQWSHVVPQYRSFDIGY